MKKRKYDSPWFELETFEFSPIMLVSDGEGKGSSGDDGNDRDDVFGGE